MFQLSSEHSQPLYAVWFPSYLQIMKSLGFGPPFLASSFLYEDFNFAIFLWRANAFFFFVVPAEVQCCLALSAQRQASLWQGSFLLLQAELRGHTDEDYGKHGCCVEATDP